MAHIKMNSVTGMASPRAASMIGPYAAVWQGIDAGQARTWGWAACCAPWDIPAQDPQRNSELRQLPLEEQQLVAITLFRPTHFAPTTLSQSAAIIRCLAYCSPASLLLVAVGTPHPCQ